MHRVMITRLSPFAPRHELERFIVEVESPDWDSVIDEVAAHRPGIDPCNIRANLVGPGPLLPADAGVLNLSKGASNA